MIDIWVKLVSHQLELALNLTRAFYGLSAKEGPVPCKEDTANIALQQQADAPAAEDPVSGIMAFLELNTRGATVREIAQHVEMDRKTVLPILKTLVREKKLEELLGRYCLIKG